jgi:hypothetical protein
MTHHAFQSVCGEPAASRTRRISSLFVRVGLCCTLLVGCGGPRSTERKDGRPRDPGQIAMRDPDRVSPNRAADASLGTLAPVEQDLPGEARAAPSKADDLPKGATPPPLIQVMDDAQGKPYPLRDGALVLTSGLVIHRVPKGVSARTLRERATGDEVWEMVDARGKRLALIKERSWRRAASSEADLVNDTRAMPGAVRRATWQGRSVQVVTDRFRSDSHIYTVDRRANGTDWIWRGLELRTAP